MSLMARHGIDRLTADEQWELYEELNQHLAESAPPLSDEIKAELDRRVALLDSGQTTLHTPEEVAAYVRANLRKSRERRA